MKSDHKIIFKSLENFSSDDVFFLSKLELEGNCKSKQGNDLFFQSKQKHFLFPNFRKKVKSNPGPIS